MVGFWHRLSGMLNPFRWLRRIIHSLDNWRRGRRRHLNYITFDLSGEIPALPEQRGWLRRRVLGDPPLSLVEVERIFRRISQDPRPQGVILMLGDLRLSLADLQSLRNSIIRLRQTGKHVICHAQSYDMASYYIASAADKIFLQPGGGLNTTGLVVHPVFLREAFDTLGVQLDVVAISPYKNSPDQFTRTSLSPEGRQQLEWLLDSRYDMLLAGYAEGRGMPHDAARAMIDGAPYVDREALEAGYVDALLNVEDLPAHLATPHIIPWEQAQRKLLRPWQRRSGKYVLVLPASGMIIPGESGSPPTPLPIPFAGGERLGDKTLVQQVRAIMQDRRAAAVILWVDSPGGSAAASEAMAAALAELARDRPLVVFMNGVAASGGYYISTPAQWIVAQPGTITGSIGVWSAKPVTQGVFANLKINRMEITRGANAGYFSDSAPFSDQQRERLRHSIEHTYGQFLERVAACRQTSTQAIDLVGGGRVWTGEQALGHGLVDELGDLWTAIDKARALARLPDDAPVAIYHGKGKSLGPQVAQKTNPAAALTYLYANTRAMVSGAHQMLLPFDIGKDL